MVFLSVCTVLGRFFGVRLRRSIVAIVALAMVAAAVSMAPAAHGSGPHWVAGSAYFNPAAKGLPVVWAGGHVSYFLDQGALSSTVSNSQAASLVAGAAQVWSSVPTAAVAIMQGGTLGEDVSGSNVTANVPAGTGAVFPSDVQASATTEPVAVVLDADGSVIDDVYGVGASDATKCTQTGVYDWVDNFATAGSLAHAVILVNGLCANSTTMDGLLQYELVRAFGRVLGLDWSQVNEAMWQTSNPTAAGLAGWPVMHPIERLCTANTTSCLPNPTTLRPDDIMGLNQLYPVTSANSGQWSGKTITATATITVTGTVAFRNGQGMQGVNVTLTPVSGGSPEVQYQVSAVTGAYFRRDAGNPVTGTTDAQGNLYGRFGTDDATEEGSFVLSGVPLPSGDTADSYQLSIEPINELYTGSEAVGPYDFSQVTPSGAAQTVQLGSLSAGAVVTQNFTMSDSADGTQTDDGIEAAPNATANNGEWLSKLVGYGHTGWFEFHARANRVFTVEALPVDATGFGAESKAAVLIGLWNGGDATGTLPDEAMTTAFNGIEVGLSTISGQTQADGEIRVAFADVRGDGRPDYTYKARLLYADSVSPARLTLNGGTIAIEGQGFRPGVVVMVNNLAAAVTSVTPTEITAVAPAVSAATGTVVVAVQDPQTLGTAEILDGLAYDAQGSDGVRLVSGPSGTVSEGVPVPMVVQVVAGDGKTPAADVAVTFSTTTGAAAMSCTATPCQVLTNGSGMATMMVTPTQAQPTQVTAALSNGASVIDEFDGGAPPQIAATNTLYIALDAQTSWTPTAIVLSGGQSLQGTVVQWSAGTGAQISGAVSSISNAAGLASTTVAAGPFSAAGTATVYACQSQNTQCASFTINAVHAELATLLPVSGVGQLLGASGTAMPVTLEVVDAAGHPLAGAQVSVYQRMTAWEPPCPATGRCASAPLLGSSSLTMASDANGLVTAVPMSGNGQPVVVQMQATTGEQGSLSWTVTQHP
jgi:hypothetical protein